MRKEYLFVSNDHPNWDGRDELVVEMYTENNEVYVLKPFTYEGHYWAVDEQWEGGFDSFKPYYTITELEEEN